jgi:small-conductance mechanosensitive channel
MESFFDWLLPFWNYQLFNLGETDFTTKSFIFLILSLFLLLYLTGKLKRLLVRKVFPRYSLDIGISQAIATIVRYTLVITGLVIIFQTSGIDLSALACWSVFWG